MFIPYRVWQRSPMAYVLRSDRDPRTLAADVRTAIVAFDGRLPMYHVRPLAGYVQDAIALRRFTMRLAAAFALTALVLTCVGVYGVVAYAVTGRRQEFGVAALRKTRKSELIDRNMLCARRGRRRTYGGSCSPVSRLLASLTPRAAWLTALTRAPRELQSNYGDRSASIDAV
jgi:hypothetical protein